MVKAGSLGTKTMRIGELIKRCIIAYLIPRFYLFYIDIYVSKSAKNYYSNIKTRTIRTFLECRYAYRKSSFQPTFGILWCLGVHLYVDRKF